jgi:TonB-linked SusC/RagA family outer membrane protein
MIRFAKIILLAALALCVGVPAMSQPRLSIQRQNITLKELFKVIEEQSEYRFFYSDDLSSLNQKVSINLADRTAEEVLGEALKGTGLTFKIGDKNLIVIVPNMQPDVAQDATRGIVTDHAGEPLAGASVVVKGTTQGVLTGTDGRFSIKSGAGATLVVSYLGYESSEVVSLQGGSVEVKLSAAERSLDEVVVVGYGSVKKVNLTGAVSSVNFEEQALSRPVTNVSSALAGLSSGVQVMQTSGQPGSDGATIRIRGVGTLNTRDPLVIVDGMEGSMDAVLPADIETISVLKDAASSAIYGARAANGVILITTKRGKRGQVNVTYSGRMSYAQPANLIEYLSDYTRHMELINESRTNIGQQVPFGQFWIDLWREKAGSPNELTEFGVPNHIAYPNTDWSRTLFGNNLLQDHSLSVRGGTNNARFLLSVGYLDNSGLVENTGLNRFSLRSNVEADVTKWLTVGTRIYGLHDNLDMGDFSDANNYLRQSVPGVTARYDGKYGMPRTPGEESTNNPLARVNSRVGDDVRLRANATAFSSLKFYEDLSWDFNANYSNVRQEVQSWTDAGVSARWNFMENRQAVAPTDPSQLRTSFSNSTGYSYTLENLLRYQHNFVEQHDLAALAGYQEYYYHSRSNSATKSGLLDPSITTPGTATKPETIDGSETDWATRSFFGRLNYAFRSRYLFEANLRSDASSRFHPDHRWGMFPSVSAAWRISEENFMGSTRTMLDNLKLRASWGQLGNSSVGNYEYQSTYGAANYPIGSILMSGMAQTAMPNSLLSWETTTSTDVGLEAALLRNRLNAELGVYNKLTSGILYRPVVDPIGGAATAPRMNIAQMRNRGLELTLSWQDKIREISYKVSGNMAYNQNMVTKYKGAYSEGWQTDKSGNRVWVSNLGEVSTGSENRVVEGKPMDVFYLRTPYAGDGSYFEADGATPKPNGGPTDGMIRTEDDARWLQAMMAATDGSGNAMYWFASSNRWGKDAIYYGDYIYADNNGDGRYGSSSDATFLDVSPQPKYNFGLQTSVSWMGLDFSTSWAGAAGFKLYWAPSAGYNIPALRNGYAIPQHIADDHYFYDPANPSDPRTNIGSANGRLVGETGFQVNEASTLHLHKGDYLKLKNLTVGYTLPKKISKKLAMEAFRIYVSGENLWTLTSFPGQDPEMGANPGYVILKQYAAGVNITF